MEKNPDSRTGVFLKGDVFDELLERHRLTQAEVANLVGISDALVSHWRTGKRPVSPEHQEALVALFGVRKAELFELIFPGKTEEVSA